MVAQADIKRITYTMFKNHFLVLFKSDILALYNHDGKLISGDHLAPKSLDPKHLERYVDE